MDGGAALQDEAEATGRSKPTAARVGLIQGIVGVVVLFLLLQAMGRIAAGFFAGEVREEEFLVCFKASPMMMNSRSTAERISLELP